MNNRNSRPETISDWIALLQAAKEKYGDLKVRRVDETYAHDEDEYYHFEDVKIVTPPVSLLSDARSIEGYLLFVY